MNIFLWVVQILLAAHTVIGAVWKFTNPEQTVPSLKAIPHTVWLGLIVVEFACSICFLLPAVNRSFAILAPIAAVVIAAEMLLFCAVHLASGATNHGPLVYWLVVAIICAGLAYGRYSMLAR